MRSERYQNILKLYALIVTLILCGLAIYTTSLGHSLDKYKSFSDAYYSKGIGLLEKNGYRVVDDNHKVIIVNPGNIFDSTKEKINFPVHYVAPKYIDSDELLLNINSEGTVYFAEPGDFSTGQKCEDHRQEMIKRMGSAADNFAYHNKTACIETSDKALPLP